MDSLAKLFSADENASYESKFDDYFADHLIFGSNIRRARPELLDRECVKGIAYKVN